MGIGKLKTAIFLKKNRWTLESNHFTPENVASVRIDHYNKYLDIKFRDVILDEEHYLEVLKWLNSDIKNETLRFNAYDGCGAILYSIVFSNIKICSNTSEFDYNSSEESTRDVLIGFEKETVEYPSKDVQCEDVEKTLPPSIKNYYWTLKIYDFNNRTIVKDSKLKKDFKRPNLNIEETMLTDKFGKTVFVPGKAVWEPISIEIEYDNILNTSALVEANNSRWIENNLTAEIALRTDEKYYEVWKLHNIECTNSHWNENKMTFDLIYSNVQYMPLNTKQEPKNKPRKIN